MMTLTNITELRDADAICADVDRGLSIVAQIAALEKERKSIEARLTMDALARPDEHEPLKDEDREGKQFIAVGTELRLPIIFTADKLVQSFAWGSDVDNRITAAAADKVSELFKSVRKWETKFKDGKQFRAKAIELFGDKAPEVIAACRAVDKDGIPKSDIKVEWERAAAHAKLESEAAA